MKGCRGIKECNINMTNSCFTKCRNRTILKTQRGKKSKLSGRCEKMIAWTIVGLVAAYGVVSVVKSEMSN